MKKTRKKYVAGVLCASMVWQIGVIPSAALPGELAAGKGVCLPSSYVSLQNRAASSFAGLEEEDQFVLGKVSQISSDPVGGSLLQITSGWDQSRLSGVAKFKNGRELFGKSEFTLSAYMYYESNQERASAFSVGNSSNYFSVNFSPSALKYAAGGGAAKSVSMKEENVRNRWVSVIVSYREDENQGLVSVYIDGVSVLSDGGIGFKLSQQESVDAYIGGTFVETSYMANGSYDGIAVKGQASDGNFNREQAEAAAAAEEIRSRAENFDFSSVMAGVSDAASAQEAVETWIGTECSDILEQGIAVRPEVTAYTAPGEAYRETFEGTPGTMEFSFKVMNQGAAAVGGSLTVEIPASVDGTGEIPVYDSFSGTHKGTGDKNQSFWLDSNGVHIQAHGGQVQSLNEAEVHYDLDGNGQIEDQDVWLWYGEDKTRDGKPIDGVNCYVSTDLYNWTDMGTVLRTHDMIPAKLATEGIFAKDGVALDESALGTLKAWAKMEEADSNVSQEEIDMAREFLEAYVDPDSETGYDEENLQLAFWNLYTGYCIVERPKMLYNEKTGQYVVVYHQDAPSEANIKNYLEEIEENGSSENTGSRYSRASMGFAVSDTPFGPFKLVNVQWMNGTYGAKPGMARDMNVFLDDTDLDENGVPDAYAIYSTEENAKLNISLLNETYTGPATEGGIDEMVTPSGKTIKTYEARVLSDNSREAPALFKYDGYYYMITSGTSGWNPNPAVYYRAENIFGPWEKMGDPCEGGSSTTFDSQSTCVIPVDEENGKFIYMGDRWRTEGDSSALWYSSYVWLPIEMTSDHRIELKNVSDWDISLLDRLGPVTINTELPETIAYGSAFDLPSAVNITMGGNTFDTPVIWDAPEALGEQVIQGYLTQLDRSISVTVNVVVRDAVYFVDCGAESPEGRTYFNEIEDLCGKTMKNGETPDQAYSPGSWGYQGNNTKARTSGDLYEMLRYVSGGTGRDLSYQFDDLEPGTYDVYLGFYSPVTWPSDRRTAEIAVTGRTELTAEHHIASNVKDMEAFEGVEVGEEGLNILISPENSGSNTDVQISYIAVCRQVPVSVDTKIDAIDVDNPYLPDTIDVTVGGKKYEDTAVEWYEADVEQLGSTIGRKTVRGMLTELDNRLISLEVVSAPANAVYFVDSGAGEKGGEFKKIASMSDAWMKNSSAPDQAYTKGSWGYEGDNTVARQSKADSVYEKLRYVASDGEERTLSYRFDDLEAGTYELRLGFYDPWYQYSLGERQIEISVETDGEKRGEPVAYTITGDQDMVILPEMELEGGEDVRLILTPVNEGSNADAMISYIALCLTEEAEIYYEVKFDSNGGTLIDSQEVLAGDYVEEPEDPQREGYVFAGWYGDKNLTEKWDFASSRVRKDLTLYAKWEKEEDTEIEYYTSRIRVTKKPKQLEYEQNEELNPEGMEVTEYRNATPSDASPSDASKLKRVLEKDEYTLEYDFSAAGVRKVVVSYFGTDQMGQEKEFTDSFTVVVKEREESKPDPDPIPDPGEDGDSDGGSGEDGNGGSSGGGSTGTGAARPVNHGQAPDLLETTGNWSQSADGTWYFVNGEETYCSTWIVSRGTWYYMTQDGSMAVGWIFVDNTWYYMNPENGALMSGWIKEDADGPWYYADLETGKMTVGWRQIDGIWYYFNEQSDGRGSRPYGAMFASETTPDGYLVDENGAWIQ